VSKLTKLLRSPAKPAHFCVRWRAARPRKKCKPHLIDLS
jgi:hypothetical protein